MTESLRSTVAPLVYLISAVFLFLSLNAVSKVRKAGRAPILGAVGLVLALLGVVLELGTTAVPPAIAVAVMIGVIAGSAAGYRVRAGIAASRVAWIPALAGGAAALAAGGSLLAGGHHGVELVAACGALGLGAVALVLGLVLASHGGSTLKATTGAAFTGVLAGWAGALEGFALHNAILLVGAGVAGTAALAVGRIMARASGKSLLDALLSPATADPSGYHNVRACGTDEAAMVLETAGTVVVVPGYGMPAAHAQHTVKEVVEQLEKRGAKVMYAVSPSAGCMPGHINIALDEANVPHEKVAELASAQAMVAEADAVLVVGANDTVNSWAASDPKSPLYGLAALDLKSARAVFVVKRSLKPGSAGVKNPLFEQPNTLMMFGDGKKVMQALVAELKGSGH
jgi:H+-translocating NAD(P) transhydrogenase subunit beta